MARRDGHVYKSVLFTVILIHITLERVYHIIDKGERKRKKNGYSPKGDRTPGPELIRLMLYHLSYGTDLR